MQDGHRQRTVNWVDSTGGTNAAFDFTTKGILQEALQRNELWRLVDAQVSSAPIYLARRLQVYAAGVIVLTDASHDRHHMPS